jgi:hypothetical protein
MTTDEKADYAVGYCKPPVGTRFQKGNRAAAGHGRPRRARNLSTLLLEALNKRVTVTEGGKRRKLAKRDLGVARLADRFAAGDLHAMKLLGQLLELERRPPAEPAERPVDDAADRLVIENLLDLLRTS